MPGGRIEGKVQLDDEDIYGAGVDAAAVRRTIGMVFQRPNPFPTMSIYDNVVAGLRLNGVKASRARRGGRAVAARRQPLGRGQGPARPARRRPVRRSAAAAVHRPGDRRRAAGAAHGRACSALDPISTLAIEDLMTELKDQLHDRHRHPQHAAGRARQRHDRRSSPSTGRPARPAGRVDDTPRSSATRREGDRGLHHRPVRMTSTAPLFAVIMQFLAPRRPAHPRGDHAVPARPRLSSRKWTTEPAPPRREVRRVLRGVYVDSSTPDDLTTRAAAAALILPPGAALARRTAAWVYGATLSR